MNWEDEPFVKLYTRRTLTMKRVGWEGRAVFAELLCCVDRAGVFDLDDEDAVEAISAVADMDEDVARTGLQRLLKKGVVTVSGSRLVIPNFVEAQSAKQSDKARQRESRARRRAGASAVSQNVTNEHASTTSHAVGSACHTELPQTVGRDVSSQNVTNTEKPSQNVTKCHDLSPPVTPRLDQIRLDETRLDKEPPVGPPPGGGAPGSPSAPSHLSPQPAPEHGDVETWDVTGTQESPATHPAAPVSAVNDSNGGMEGLVQERALDGRSGAVANMATSKARKRRKKGATDPEAQAEAAPVMETWHREFPQYAERGLVGDRLKRFKARRRDGVSVELMCNAVRGAKFDDWHMGRTRDTDPDKPPNDLAIILRSVSTIEQLADLWKSRGNGHRPAERKETDFDDPGPPATFGPAWRTN